jgi:hypothetical protein
MALPPNGLTTILDQCKTPEEMIDALSQKGCLTEGGLRDRRELLRLIQKAIRSCEGFYKVHWGYSLPVIAFPMV